MLRRKIKPWPNFKPHVDTAWGKHRTWREGMWSENDPTEDQRYGRRNARGSRRQVLLIRPDIYLGFTQQLLNIRPCVGTKDEKSLKMLRGSRESSSHRQNAPVKSECMACALYSPQNRERSALPRLLHVATKTIKYPFTVPESRGQNQSCGDNQEAGRALLPLESLEENPSIVSSGYFRLRGLALCSYCFLLCPFPVPSCFKDMNNDTWGLTDWSRIVSPSQELCP